MPQFIEKTDIGERFDNIATAPMCEREKMHQLQEIGAQVLEYWDEKENFDCAEWAMKRIGITLYQPGEFCRSAEFGLMLAMDVLPHLKLIQDPQEGDLVTYRRYSQDFFDELAKFDDPFIAHEAVFNRFQQERGTGYKSPYRHYGILREIGSNFYVDSKFGKDYHVFRTPLEFDYYSTQLDFFRKVNDRDRLLKFKKMYDEASK